MKCAKCGKNIRRNEDYVSADEYDQFERFHMKCFEEIKGWFK